MSYQITARQQESLERLKSFHFHDCKCIDWHKQSAEPFSKGQLGPNEKIWFEKKRNYIPSQLMKLTRLSKIKIKYWKFKRAKGKKLDDLLYKKWEDQYPFVQSILEGDQEVWRKAVKSYATFHRHTEIARGYSLHVYNPSTLECDVYLHHVDQIVPEKIEKATKRGKLRYHDMPKTKRYALYEEYVYSCLVRIIDDLFAVLPCRVMYINGIVGSREKHDPIISTVINRNQYRKKRNPINTLNKKHRCVINFKKRSGFYPVKRVYSPTILEKEE